MERIGDYFVFNYVSGKQFGLAFKALREGALSRGDRRWVEPAIVPQTSMIRV